jgi:uncharacterized protein DUF4166
MDISKEIMEPTYVRPAASITRPVTAGREDKEPARRPHLFVRTYRASHRVPHRTPLCPSGPDKPSGPYSPSDRPDPSSPQGVNGIHGIQGLLGDTAWNSLPPAVRTRFGEPTLKVDYVGEFDIVRASIVGRVIAWLCQAIGTPVVPRTGERVPAVIHVGPVDRGASWLREYQWPQGRTCQVQSTKVVSPNGTLTEELPAGLRMPLTVYQQRGVLHFVSTGYYFELGRHLKIPLPSWLSPGTTHVEHADESKGWFRFTMTVTHPLFGEVFYQTGRFRAAADPS